ncbi:bacterio-opsin activator domain-containing protein [Halobacteriaceae archaeon GCM10025711]
MNPRDRRPIIGYEAAAELEFRVRDDDCFMIVESGRAHCEMVLDEMIQQTGGNLLVFVSVYDAPAGRVLADAMDSPHIADARVLVEDENASLLELVVTGPCLAATVADSRAIPRLISANDGVGRVVVQVPPLGDSQRVIEVFRERHPDSELVARREHDVGPLFTERVFFEERILGHLTDRQREALVTAYEKGYFDRPRRTTAVDCAEALGISQPTFSQHLSVALDKVLDAIIGDQFDP